MSMNVGVNKAQAASYAYSDVSTEIGASAITIVPGSNLGRAYDALTGKDVNSIVDLYSPGMISPEYGRQWHLRWLGNIAEVWKEYRGQDVSVGVYDSGIDYPHWDLSANYDATKHVVVDGVTYDGKPIYNDAVEDAPHGTSVAGLIAAAQNGRGGVGVAYEASLTGINIFDLNSPLGVNGDTTDINSPFFQGIRQGAQFDVVNHSWGGFYPGWFLFDRQYSDSFTYRLERALEYVAENGRDGLGTVSVKAAGNNGLDGQNDSFATSRFVVAVGAYRQADGVASNYSNSGPGLLVSAPSNDFSFLGGTGLVSTDMLGELGYNQSNDPDAASDMTDQFGGTSGATPIVSGVVSLMLDANENLGWRDVKNILAASAKMPVAFDTGPVLISVSGDGGTITTGRMNERSFQLSGQNANWNGGAMHFSNDYGYGAVDAYNAVRMAEVWSLFGDAKTSANEIKTSVDVQNINLHKSLEDTDEAPTRSIDFYNDFQHAPATATFTIPDNIDIEHIDLKLDFSAYMIGELDLVGSPFPILGFSEMVGGQIKLIAPDGTEAFTARPSVSPATGTELADNFITFGFSGFRGADSQGTWTLALDTNKINLSLNLFGLQVNGFAWSEILIKHLKIDLYGSAPDPDNVYTYTNEFFKMTAIDGESARRTSLSDTNGGTDWINAAAIASNVEASLDEGGQVRFGGKDAFKIASGTRIENIVTGDGNDRLFGNALDNQIHGMRGNDWLNGGGGNDTLFGGTGEDVFAFDTAGVSGNDQILDWTGADRIATSKQLRGADQNGLITVGTNALVLLDNSARGDTAELVGQGGAVLQALGKNGDYWWYGWAGAANAAFVDGHVRELSVGSIDSSLDTALNAVTPHDLDADLVATGGDASIHDSAFYVYNVMGDAMASGIQTAA